jgi:hypothetical protein
MQHAGSKHPRINTDNVETFWLNERLPPPPEQANSLVQFIGDRSIMPGSFCELATSEVAAWIGVPLPRKRRDSESIIWLLEQLTHQGLLQKGSAASEEKFSARLSIEGWKHYAELKKTHASTQTAFMAMKFGDPALTCAVQRCFKPAVARTGFELRMLTDQQPAGLIDNQIRASILSGRFVIADLTHANPGAYWEAGFAEGLGQPVIYTCEQFVWEREKTHFDTNHMNTLIWNLADLKTAENRLAATIRATFRADAKQTD